MGVSTSLLTFAEFEQLPDEPGKLEFLDGELIRLPPAERYHMRIAHRLFLLWQEALATGERRSELGEACLETGYKIESGAWLQPDFSVQHADQPGDKYPEGAPALAVEIISESNRAEQMDRKVKKYLANGGIEVWLVYPKTESVWVFRQSRAEEFRGMLRSEIIPGLTIDLDRLFAPRPD
jgi:Uma2 family endonuclease